MKLWLLYEQGTVAQTKDTMTIYTKEGTEHKQHKDTYQRGAMVGMAPLIRLLPETSDDR